MRSVRADSCKYPDVPASGRPQLGRLIVTPFATIGVLSAVLVWEVEHVGSILLAIAIAAIGVTIGALVAQHLRRDIDKLTDTTPACCAPPTISRGRLKPRTGSRTNFSRPYRMSCARR